MAKLSATEASRGFSDLLNRVGGGEQIEIVRSGATIAIISPAHAHIVAGRRLLEVLEDLPALDDDFAADVAAARGSVGPPPSIDWPD